MIKSGKQGLGPAQQRASPYLKPCNRASSNGLQMKGLKNGDSEARIAITNSVHKSDIEILNQHIDNEDGAYRVRVVQRVHCIHIPTTVFDEKTMCRPYLLIPELPDLPTTDWTTMRISRRTDGALESVLSFDPLPAAQEIWHPQKIDVLSLERKRMFKSPVVEVLYHGQPAITKIACFDWDIPRIDKETWAYSTISQHQQQHPNIPRIAPEFLAHLTENGRVIGILMEKIDGEFASIDDLPACEEALRRVHDIGWVHGDVNRYNFMVDRT